MQVRRDKKGQQSITKALESLGKKVGKAGWFPSAKYENGTPVAVIAAQNEYGNPSKGIPARPFMRPTVAAKRSGWAKELEKGSRAVLAGTATAEQVMLGVASLAASEIAETISQIHTPPLAPATIAARLRKRKLGKIVGLIDKPLIETKILFNTVQGVVEDA